MTVFRSSNVVLSNRHFFYALQFNEAEALACWPLRLDWSHVKPRTVSHLDPNLILIATTPRPAALRRPHSSPVANLRGGRRRGSSGAGSQTVSVTGVEIAKGRTSVASLMHRSPWHRRSKESVTAQHKPKSGWQRRSGGGDDGPATASTREDGNLGDNVPAGSSLPQVGALRASGGGTGRPSITRSSGGGATIILGYQLMCFVLIELSLDYNAQLRSSTSFMNAPTSAPDIPLSCPALASFWDPAISKPWLRWLQGLHGQSRRGQPGDLVPSSPIVHLEDARQGPAPAVPRALRCAPSLLYLRQRRAAVVLCCLD